MDERENLVEGQDGCSEMKNVRKHGFSSKIGFVLAAAGSAVGLGNLWRFPYLSAQYGGGTFLFFYILFCAAFGFILLMLEISIGRKTGKGVIEAFTQLCARFRWLGWLAVLTPLIIICYYSDVGGWVLKYMWAFVSGDTSSFSASETASEYFASFTSGVWQPTLFFVIFAAVSVGIVVFGVRKGIERMSKILMPALAVIAVFLMIYVCCQSGAGEGVRYFFVPEFENVTWKTPLAALGQLFYSLSLASATMVTYGSYMRKDAKIPKSAVQIAVCDSLFAMVASLIVIPSVFAYSSDPRSILALSGPPLMFEQLPVIFMHLPAGRFIGSVFFLLVFFAAVTSSVSMVEAVVTVLCENFRFRRWQACLAELGVILAAGMLCVLGYGPLSMINIDGKNILDMMDYFANSILMPFVSLCTCILCGFFADTHSLMDEIGLKRKWTRRYFAIMVRYAAPLCIIIIMVSGYIGL